jgi:hypothetical protein
MLSLPDIFHELSFFSEWICQSPATAGFSSSPEMSRLSMADPCTRLFDSLKSFLGVGKWRRTILSLAVGEGTVRPFHGGGLGVEL